MGKEADIKRVFDETASKLGPIDAFVHSSGIIGADVARSTRPQPPRYARRSTSTRSVR